MSAYNGACHCGAIRVTFETDAAPEALTLRACQCGFCRRHGAHTVSDPAGFLHIRAAPGAVQRYHFGRNAVDALICEGCGVYVASALVIDEVLKATLNVIGVDLDAFAARPAEPVDYNGETDDARRERRRDRWRPAEVVESVPSA